MEANEVMEVVELAAESRGREAKRRWVQENRERVNERARARRAERRATEPGYWEGVLAAQRERNGEERNAKQRAKYAADPEYRERVQERVRARRAARRAEREVALVGAEFNSERCEMETIRERHVREMDESGWGGKGWQLDGCGGCGRAYRWTLHPDSELGLEPNDDDLCQDCAAAGVDPLVAYAGGQDAARAREVALVG